MVRTILVADDEPPIVQVVADILEDAGYRVLCASNASEALALLEREHPDLLLTDHAMPGLTGLDLIDRIADRPDLAVPVILMSAVEPLPVPPATAFLPKPFVVAALLGAVSAQLESA